MSPSSIERLESRIAPATIVNHKTVIFSDVDGDDVTVHFSKPIITPATFAKGFFFTDSPARMDGSIPQSLVSIYVLGMKVGSAAQGLDISVTATKSAAHGGNGRVDVSFIGASRLADDGNPTDPNSVDLGTVRIEGDLGGIRIGDEDFSTPALRFLEVGSLGVNCPDGGGADIFGGVGKIKIGGEMHAYIQLLGDYGVGKIIVGGSVGGMQDAYDFGEIAAPSIGTLIIGGDLIGGEHSGNEAVFVKSNIGSIKIGGSVIAGADYDTGLIQCYGSIGDITIGGSIIGGGGGTSGAIRIGSGKIGSIVVGGDLIGGSGWGSGQISGFSSGAVFGSIFIGGNVIGGSGTDSGSIGGTDATADSILAGASLSSVSAIHSVLIQGKLVGGMGKHSGSIEADRIGNVSIGFSVVGGFAHFSGSIRAQSIGDVSIVGDLIGLQDTSNPARTIGSGSIIASLGSIHNVFIGGDLYQASIIAGIHPGDDNLWGTGTDYFTAGTASAKTIHKVVIGGSARSTYGHYGIEAAAIDVLRIHGVAYPHSDPNLNFGTGFIIDAAQGILVREI